MNVYERKDLLGRQPESTLRFTLPTGDAIPAHFHLTEPTLYHVATANY